MKAVFIIMALFITNYCLGQCSQSTSFDSSIFLKKTVHKQDTIFFKAIFQSLGKVAQRNVMQQLAHRGIILNRNYRTALSLTPVGTDVSIYLPYKDIDEEANRQLFTNQNKQITLCVRGIIVSGFEKVDDKPFFLIDKIWFN